jgi:hypothetical protein
MRPAEIICIRHNKSPDKSCAICGNKMKNTWTVLHVDGDVAKVRHVKTGEEKEVKLNGKPIWQAVLELEAASPKVEAKAESQEEVKEEKAQSQDKSSKKKKSKA